MTISCSEKNGGVILQTETIWWGEYALNSGYRPNSGRLPFSITGDRSTTVNVEGKVVSYTCKNIHYKYKYQGSIATVFKNDELEGIITLQGLLPVRLERTTGEVYEWKYDIKDNEILRFSLINEKGTITYAYTYQDAPIGEMNYAHEGYSLTPDECVAVAPLLAHSLRTYMKLLPKEVEVRNNETYYEFSQAISFNFYRAPEFVVLSYISRYYIYDDICDTWDLASETCSSNSEFYKTPRE